MLKYLVFPSLYDHTESENSVGILQTTNVDLSILQLTTRVEKGSATSVQSHSPCLLVYRWTVRISGAQGSSSYRMMLLTEGLG